MFQLKFTDFEDIILTKKNCKLWGMIMSLQKSKFTFENSFKLLFDKIR